MALNFQPYQDRAGEETRRRWAGGLEDVFNTYMAAKQNAQQQGRLAQQDTISAQARINAEKDRQGANLLQYGFDPRAVTPEVLARSQPGMTPQGPAQPGMPSPEQAENPLFGAVRSYLDKKKQAASMSTQEQALGMDKTKAETAKLTAEAGVLGEKPAKEAAAKGLKAEDDLRGELQTLSKPFVQVRDSMGRIEAAAKNPSAAGDLALIFNYMKVLDPGSTVREGEFATAQNSAGMPERIRAKYNSVVNGERLEESQRADFVDRARDLYKSQEAIQKQTEANYKSLAERRGANPANVILNQGLAKQTGGREEVPLRDASGKTRIALYEGPKFVGWK